MMNIVLYKLCCHAVMITPDYYPLPSTILSMQCKLSLYKTRKELNKLKEDGLVISCVECLVAEYGNYIMRGYKITKKAEKTIEYKKAYEEERKIVKEIFGFDIGSLERKKEMERILES